MRTNVVLPKWGMGIEEGTVTRWFKVVGERIEKGEPLVEVETAKALQEVEAPASGTLVQIFVTEGQTALVNADIAVIDESHG
jgi:pyruvate/2-oxoglutarate dehydrogenase complex dihydrolipoamide acyltransferase (E2) component